MSELQGRGRDPQIIAVAALAGQPLWKRAVQTGEGTQWDRVEDTVNVQKEDAAHFSSIRFDSGKVMIIVVPLCKRDSTSMSR